ncbi:RNA polymerase sigma factor [Aliiglaciecola sp. LCG003]|uniref:RNA polymerase sigma factor n=1 Tax=Aliiglaciecola sp. LCG003 TaxID=3053655 RepID=UPI00257297F0|nr:RNA polymerase sigma factor [Aliiglaciecola sp. LCG003]WJG09367.1 RNA polymerase sigma factor [Aliiglaciecola sp. LCG003]
MSKEFDRILSEYGPMLSRVASSYEANEHLRQELLQEISLAVWQALKGFKGNSSLKTYVLRVAHNKAVTHVSYHSKQPNNDSYCEVDNPIAAVHQQTSEQNLSQQAAIQHLLEGVRKLPLQARQIITMSMEGLSYQEIAEVCGIKSVNVGVIINRAKKTLMEQVQYEQ